jgi:hypothetical protein
MAKKGLLVIILIMCFSCVFAADKITEKKIRQIFNSTKSWEYATSELKENGYMFSVSNLLEEYGNSGSCWATHINGGVGESVLIYFLQPNEDSNEKWQKGIGIINGFAKSEVLYKANNRAKDIEVKLYRFEVNMLQGTIDAPKGMVIGPDLKLLEQTNITLNDNYLSENRLYFSTDLAIDNYEVRQETGSIYGYALVLTMKSVYKGSKFNDLCISEISFLTNVEAGARTDGGATN